MHLRTAPTDDAFAVLPKGTLDSLLLPANIGKLKNILLYHIVPGNYLSTSLQSMTYATAANGATVRVVKATGNSGTKIFVYTAKVITADIIALNGIVHIIDKVLLPPTIPTKRPTTNAPSKDL